MIKNSHMDSFNSKKIFPDILDKSFSKVRKQFQELKKVSKSNNNHADKRPSFENLIQISENSPNVKHTTTYVNSPKAKRKTDVKNNKGKNFSSKSMAGKRKLKSFHDTKALKATKKSAMSKAWKGQGVKEYMHKTSTKAGKNLIFNTCRDDLRNSNGEKNSKDSINPEKNYHTKNHAFKDNASDNSEKSTHKSSTQTKSASKESRNYKKLGIGLNKLQLNLENHHKNIDKAEKMDFQNLLDARCLEKCSGSKLSNSHTEKSNSIDKKDKDIAKILADPDFNFLNNDDLSEKLSISMHEIQIQDIMTKSAVGEKSSFLIKKSIMYNKFLEGSPIKRKKLKKISVEKKLENICLVDILLEMNVFKMKFNDMVFKNVFKCGEATFSEVFNVDGLIYKIVPIGDNEEEGLTTLENFFRECYIFDKIKSDENVCDMVKIFFVSGRYPMILLNAWDEYKNQFGSESETPLNYKKDQKFGIIVMENSGIDLEKYNFQNKEEVKNFIKQLIGCVARLEEKYDFEHRDLHWGNVMIKNEDSLKVKIIDFSLSRIRCNSSLVYSNLKNKLWLFEGDEQCDEQFGVYKKMRNFCGDDWSLFIPMTNVLWIKYIINKVEQKSNMFSLKVFIKSIKNAIESSENSVKLYDKVSKIC